MRRLSGFRSVPFIILLIGCGEFAVSEQSEAIPRTPGSIEYVMPATKATEPSVKDPSSGENPKAGTRDVCLIAKARPIRSQCVIASLKGLELGKKHYDDATISIMACRPTDRAILDNAFFLGDYEARTAAYPGPRTDMARVIVRTPGADLFDPTREGIVGKVSIFEIDDAHHDVVRGEVIVETGDSSKVFLKRPFEAVFLGHYLNVSDWPSPDYEWEPGGAL